MDLFFFTSWPLPPLFLIFPHRWAFRLFAIILLLQVKLPCLSLHVSFVHTCEHFPGRDVNLYLIDTDGLPCLKKSISTWNSTNGTQDFHVHHTLDNTLDINNFCQSERKITIFLILCINHYVHFVYFSAVISSYSFIRTFCIL